MTSLHQAVRVLSLLALVVGTLLFGAGGAEAAVLVVNKLSDTYDGTCDLDCSLRDAIDDAGSGDTIKLPDGVIALTLAGTGLHESGDLDVFFYPDITIEGTGSSVIRGGSGWADRIFELHAPSTLRALTVSGGNVPDTAGDFADFGGGIKIGGTATLEDVVVEGNIGPDQGGGIYTEGDLDLVRSRVSGNRSPGTQGRGAGIYTTGAAQLNIVDSVVSGNVANATGGGVMALSFADITDSVITGNTADVGGGLNSQIETDILRSSISGNTATNEAGGGLWIQSGSVTVAESTVGDNAGNGINLIDGSLTLSRSTVARNVVTGAGGGLFFSGGSGIIDNSTISGNRATVDGGALRVNGGSLTFTNSTITKNVADSDGENTANHDGGGIGINNGTVNLKASILAGNIDASAGGSPVVHPDCTDDVTSQGINVFGDTTGCTVALQTSDVNVDPMLGDLKLNGGPTETHALSLPSVLDLNDDDAACGGVDQRGVPRPSDEDCDPGAYEHVVCDSVVVNVVGTSDADALEGTSGDDGVLALAGDDTVSTHNGNDRVCAGKGSDTVFGGDGDDSLFGEAGKDKLFGENGDDLLNGGPGRKDRCKGGPGADTLRSCERR